MFKGAMLWLLAGQSVGPFRREFQLLVSGFAPDVIDVDEERFNSFALILELVLALGIVALAARSRAADGEPVSVAKMALVAVAIVCFNYLIVYFGRLMTTFQHFPNVLVVKELLIAVHTFATRRTMLGRRIYALGGKEKAIKLSGADAERPTFVNMGMLAAVIFDVINRRSGA